MNKKYKQIIIPEVLTDIKTFQGLTRKKLNLFAEAYYHKNLKGKSVVNKHLGITINFSADGSSKIRKGSALYPYKAIALLKLKQLMEVAEYNNFGKPKANDPKALQGFLNFKVKCKINRTVKHFRISILLYKNNKAFYNHEMNIIKKKTQP